MSEQQTVVSEGKEPEAQGGKEVNQDSSVEDILASQEEAEPSEESTASKDEQSGEPGEGVKTQDEEVGTSDKSDDEVKEGTPVPYTRFKQVNEAKKTLETEIEQHKADLEEAETLLRDPDVLELVLKKQGYTDKAITDYFQEHGIDRGGSKDEPDLKTVEGWKKFITDQIQSNIQPIQKTLTQKEQQALEAEHNKWLDENEKEARKISKEKYGIEFGTFRQDEGNPGTAVGKMWQYLQDNPKDAALGFVKILKLAMAEDAVAAGEKKGIKKEKDRQKTARAGAMESEAEITGEEKPDASWSVEKIMEYREAHGD